MAFDATLGGASSNSLLTEVRAIELLSDLPASTGINEWLNFSTEEQQQTLVASTFSINPLPWKGAICGDIQALAWPRVIEVDGRSTVCEYLPRDVELATAYTAAFMGKEGGYVGVGTGGGESETDSAPFPGLTPADLAGYEQVDLGNGALRLRLTEQSEFKTGFGFIPAFAADLLRKYVQASGGWGSSRISVSSTARLYQPYITGRYRRGDGIYENNGKIYPRTGGWLSNP